MVNWKFFKESYTMEDSRRCSWTTRSLPVGCAKAGQRRSQSSEIGEKLTETDDVVGMFK